MWVCLFFLGAVLAAPADEFHAIVHDGDLAMNDDNWLKQIIPSGYSPQIFNKDIKYSSMLNIDDKDNEHFKILYSFVEKGVTEKGLIFNIYDDDMRNAAIALFRLLRDTRLYNRIDYDKLKDWARLHVNDDMFDYAKRLTSLYSSSYISEDKFLPPFVFKPNYFINGETFVKGLYFKNNHGRISERVQKNYQILKIEDNKFAINTNYSGWNVPLNGCDEQISYFKDDIELNSYYYGIHLMHPFWMSNEELDEINPMHAEHYYYTHQQLLARYRLEKEHLGSKDSQVKANCEADYNPYLYYENGMAFPTRSSVLGNNRNDLAHLKSIDIAIRECIYRGLVIMNGTLIKVSPKNYIDLMTKLIRANLDGIKSAKLMRSIFGYGSNGYPVDKHNPTPSLLHHPQTTLRDPVYWFLMERGLDYFSEYTNNSEPYDLTEYETDDLNITDISISRISTTYQYCLVNMYKALNSAGGARNHDVSIFARQRRLSYMPFTMNFTVESKSQKSVIVRLFLGPQCSVDVCLDLHFRFYELDCYPYKLDEGSNLISWTPDASSKFTNYNSDDYDVVTENIEKHYNIHKFPKNLVIPKGLENGLNLTIFVMIDDDAEISENYLPSMSLYHKESFKHDSKPFGFPFHRKAEAFKDNASNYRFLNITVYHKKEVIDGTGYFSPHLY